MSITPRIEVNLAAIEHNSKVLVKRLRPRGISITGVTKATLGSPEVAKAMLRGGIKRLGDSRVENLQALRDAGISAPLTLLRAAPPDWADRVVACANQTLLSDMDVAHSLAAAAGRKGRSHGIVVMVELGDLREGVMPRDVLEFATAISRTKNLVLMGIGTNLGCASGVIPGVGQMRQLSDLIETVGHRVGVAVPMTSGGNSSNLTWALGDSPVGAINDLRIGEAILLGVDPLTHLPIEGLHQDAFTVVASVIESRLKPIEPWGPRSSVAFQRPATHSWGPPRGMSPASGDVIQTIVALGTQDVDPDGLRPPRGIRIMRASSDHIVLETPERFAAGEEIHFGVTYASLTRAMTSPFVAERIVTKVHATV